MLQYIFLLGIVFTLAASKVTDEQYALMPEIFHLDDYDNCMLLKDKALYCYVAFQLSPKDTNNIPEVWKTIKEVSSSHLRYRHDLIRHMICVPKTCPNVNTFNTSDPKFTHQIRDCFNDRFKRYELKGTVEEVICKTANPVYETDKWDHFVAILFGSYILLVAILSLYDLYKRYNPEEKYKIFKDSTVGKWTTIFSIPSNWSKLKTFPAGKDFERLRSVQGIRVYMTFLVIMVHTCLSVSAIPVSNPQWYEEINENPTLAGEFPKRGIFLLSFHFMMSTWILINSLLEKHDRNEEIDTKFIIKSIIKRYVRFMPTFALIVFFLATWFRHIPFGPYGYGACDEAEKCRENWWANILLIQNFVNRYRMCHIISWYLAVEMHYYIISLVLIKFLLKYRSKMQSILPLLLILSSLFTFLDHYRHQYPSTLEGSPEEVYRLVFNTKPRWHDHFGSYHANFAGSLMGLWFGYIYYTQKNQPLSNKSILRTILWWIFTFGLLGSVIMIPMFVNVDLTPVHSALWVAATRPLFSAGMGLLVLGISQGLIGGFVKWTLEWPPLQILAKLSFCVYVSHFIPQSIRVGLMRNLSFLNYYEFATLVLSDIFIAFLTAIPLTLLIEMPSNEIVNKLIKEEKRKKP